MPDALELNTTATTDATVLAETMFGDGIEVVSATLSGAPTQAGTYSGGDATSGDVVPSDSGVILSTGDIADFTTEGSGTNTNTASGTTTNHGGAGDPDLDTLSTTTTHDAVVFEATFVPDDDYITMQLVFSSEEYLEYVNSGVNDTLGIWVNDEFVPLTSSGDTVSIDTVNNASNSNLYIDNPANADAYNTEMDGFTVTLSFKAPVNAGEENTIRIGLADGGDGAYDTNVLIAADSVQTVALAFEDEVTLEANTSAVLDVLANDHDASGEGLTITEINGEVVSPGDSVTLNTGETVTLNSDYTLTVDTDSDIGETVFTYTVENTEGTSDVGYVIIQTVEDAPLDGIVEGGGAAEMIDASFSADPEGDMIDAGDATGILGTTGDDDYVLAHGGDDVVESGLGDDIVYGGTGDDALHGMSGDDSLFGEEGDDKLVGGSGGDVLSGGSGGDVLAGETGDDLLDGGTGSDEIHGGGGDDTISLSDGFGNDTITGGETGETDGDTLDMSGVTSGVQLDLTASDPEAGSVFENGSAGGSTRFAEIENIVLSAGRDTVHLADGSGQDVVSGFDISDSGDGSAVDQLNVEKLTSDGGTTPVTTTDVEVTSDAYGNAVLTFTGGESITLEGVNPLDLSTVDDLVAIGIPDGRDYIVEGTSGADTIDAGYTGDPEGDLVDAGDALDGSDDDVIEAGAGDDSVVAGAGDDSVQGDGGADTIEGGAGADTLRGGEGNDSLDGGEGADSLYGGEDDDTIIGGVGADTIDGFTGADSIMGGDGDDSISGHDGDDTIHGGAGDDWLRGSVGNDEMWGGTGDDYIWSGFNDDTIRIENDFGNDTIEAEGVNETTGDVLDLSLVTDDLTIDLSGSNPEVGTFSDGTSTAQFNEIENIILGGGNDTIVLADLSGSDSVQGFDMTDSGDGTTNDQLDVSGLTSDWGTTPVHAGDVTVTDDGNGNATLTFPGGENITLIGVAPSELATIDDLVSIGIPDARDFVVEGSSGADTIDASYTGDPEGDRIDANDHSDGSNDDKVEAGAGDDIVISGAGDDTVSAGAGHDQISAGTGDDLVKGEGGDDTVSLEDGFGNDTLIAGEDFENLGDTLDLSAVSSDLTVDLTNADPEDLTVSDGSSTAAAQEFENLILGGGEDTLTLADGGGDDVVGGFDMDDRGDGRTNDQLDVTGLTTDGSTPVTAWDVTVTDTNGDGSGDAILTFPGGESITLEGVTPDQVDSAPELFAIGIPCFTPGALIVTAEGEKPVEDIRPGDLVLTADNGFQPVRWTGSRTLDAGELEAQPELKPYVIRKGAFGNTRKMVVSPQHGFVMKTDAGEKLIRAKHAAELFGGQIARREMDCEAVTYVHILFDRHEIVFAEGALTEAFYPGPQALKSIDRDAMVELLTLFPELARVAFGDGESVESYGPPARDYLLGRDIRAMAKEIQHGAD